ncbi:MerR family transcriptional regulator [Shewanella sp. GXUN23E]|uniref:MerR family transcriptional regulator n=1 Tax=Shewanella sp. GXUN23E TaxID=3422498 RepID=UPI003D7C9FF1
MTHYRISELAQAVGLSRSTLLYYEKLGLITGKRQSNGYRIYTDRDLQRLRLLLKLQTGGLTLKQCQACIEAKVDKTLLSQRLAALDEEIAQKQASRDLLAALLGQGKLKDWHAAVDEIAPDAHLEFLMNQGFSKKEALRLKWISKDMNEHEQYMADFMKVFEALERWGPGSEADTLKALHAVPFAPQQLLEIGCGKGLATQVLAAHTQASITAMDNEDSALASLIQLADAAGFGNRINTINADMTDIPLPAGSFDLLWAEGSAYIMGVDQALQRWQPLLTDNGVLVLSDLVWLTDSPSEDAVAFWKQDYPAMTSVETRLNQAKATGYKVLNSFTLSEKAWRNYYQPLDARVQALQSQMPDSAALEAIAREVDIFKRRLGEFGYQFFVLQKA